MGRTPPQPYRLGDGRIVTPANPAPVWSPDPRVTMQHDVEVIQQFGLARTPRERRLTHQETCGAH